MHSIRRSLFNIVLVLLPLLASCSSAPPIDRHAVSLKEAETWFQNFCSKPGHEVTGEVVMKSKTPEFKGQYPASIHFEKNGNFVMEVTSIVSSTMMRMSGSSAQGIEIFVPSKSQYNRKGVRSYLGLEYPVLTQLLQGDLPCPEAGGKRKVTVDQNAIISLSTEWKWVFERSDVAHGSVPVVIHLSPVAGSETALIEMKIEEWDQAEHYAKKVNITTPQGELKWTWRSRKLD